MVNESRRECMGWMTALSGSLGLNVLSPLSDKSMLSFGEEGFSGYGIS